MNSATTFYDQFLNKLISDYAFGNPRIERAIEFTLASLPSDATRVLDIGFGIGWSSQEIVRHFPRLTVQGMDLSPVLVAFAQRLSNHERTSFSQQDLTLWAPGSGASFEAAVLLDVYEHIPLESREVFHAALRTVLAPNATVVLACPSVKHQVYLRKHQPEGLQPVDEDVTQEDAERLAVDLGLALLRFESKTIWNDGDYNHILIGPASKASVPSEVLIKLQSAQERRRRLHQNCGLRVHARSLTSSIEHERRICIASPSLDSYSETFIKRHVQDLAFDVVTLSGPKLDRTPLDWQPPAPEWSVRAWRKIKRILGRHDPVANHLQKQVTFLRASKVQALLAEYGPTGVKVLDACRQVGVPLIVHFHGYDAYNEDQLVISRPSYQKLFHEAAALIAVSRDMVQRLQSLGAPADKIHHVPYFVDPAAFPMQYPAAASPVLLCVGRFVEKKAPHLTLLAFARVLRQVPDARLEMAGDGPLFGACKWLARSLGIEHAVTFHGSKSHAWVANAMGRVRAFVQHSVRAVNGDSEGTPVAVLEAQCSGVPVIATRHTGIMDVVLEGETGLLCDEGDVGSMANAMIALLEDPARAGAMGSRGRERVVSAFSREQTLGRLEAIINSVIPSVLS